VRKLTFRRRAQRDLETAASWYEAQERLLGLRFWGAVDDTIARAAESPSHFPVINKGVRRALVSGFPYAIFFKATDSNVLVLAIVHLRRHPDTWRRRAR
jgi:plasmid stabilization system protein ParE